LTWTSDLALKSDEGQNKLVQLEDFMTLTIEVDLPPDPNRFCLPKAVTARLQSVLEREDSGQRLSEEERAEAEGLVDLAELLSLVRRRAERTLP
jgi:hypothetical protein